MKKSMFTLVFFFLNCSVVVSREDCYDANALSEMNSNLCTPLNILIAEDLKLNRTEQFARDRVTISNLNNSIFAACLSRQSKVKKCDNLPSLEK